jgi:hypothetical protein
MQSSETIPVKMLSVVGVLLGLLETLLFQVCRADGGVAAGRHKPFLIRVTRRVCEKLDQKVAQRIYSLN